MTTTTTKTMEEITLNKLVEDAVDAVIAEAISHFNVLKKTVRNPEEDARYFYNDEELNTFLKQIIYPNSIWVSTIKNPDGSFFAYRVGRIITTKKHGVKKL